MAEWIKNLLPRSWYTEPIKPFDTRLVVTETRKLGKAGDTWELVTNRGTFVGTGLHWFNKDTNERTDRVDSVVMSDHVNEYCARQKLGLA